eukprot:gnl/Dysnectes_brevis/1327_a1490_2374.p1 GENE.gnl/Dysnectes_brevis/1327_a1490_2374~~gnl/Dysnectes_brevis/1327_a1490_2374.p1  ORF type:complete len:324 (+),score=72.44 gnl/Dysnectes_brevis/1327_a1490_2374:44-1015(+)
MNPHHYQHPPMHHRPLPGPAGQQFYFPQPFAGPGPYSHMAPPPHHTFRPLMTPPPTLEAIYGQIEKQVQTQVLKMKNEMKDAWAEYGVRMRFITPELGTKLIKHDVPVPYESLSDGQSEEVSAFSDPEADKTPSEGTPLPDHSEHTVDAADLEMDVADSLPSQPITQEPSEQPEEPPAEAEEPPAETETVPEAIPEAETPTEEPEALDAPPAHVTEAPVEADTPEVEKKGPAGDAPATEGRRKRGGRKRKNRKKGGQNPDGSQTRELDGRGRRGRGRGKTDGEPPVCSLEGCNRPVKARENGSWYRCCSKTHREKMTNPGKRE